MTQSSVLMDSAALDAALDELSEQILTRHGDCERLALIGIQRRGVYLADRLARRLRTRLGHPLPTGVLDITLYRDDWTTLTNKPTVGPTMLPFDVQGKNLLLVDDVLFTGRTIRAALEALADFGRPRKVELLVLVDRGHRELPIHPDYTGLKIDTARKEHIDVLLTECDQENSVILRKD